MSLEQRVAQLEKALQKREPLPVMVWHEERGMRHYPFMLRNMDRSRRLK